MNLIDKVNQDLAQNLKNGNMFEADVLKMLKDALLKHIKDNGRISAEEEIKIVRKEIKTRQEASDLYLAHSEEKRSEIERKEALILKKYLPKELSNKDIAEIVEDIMKNSLNANFGQIMGEAMGRVKGRADSKVVMQVIKSKLKGEK